MPQVNDKIGYFCALFDRKMRPAIAGIRIGDKTIITPLFLQEFHRSFYDITQSVEKFRRWIEQWLLKDRILVTNDFKSLLSGFKFKDPLPKEQLRVYDTFIPLPKIPSTFAELSPLIEDQLSAMQKQKLKRWQNIAANSSVVYEFLERRGILVGGFHQHPKWSHRTYSGRSKNTGFNLQGTSANDHITDPYGNNLDIFVNFDWRAADVRIAAILSRDEVLDKMSIESDPYLKLSEILDISRKDCKTMLLVAINKIDVDNPIFEIFPDLKKWMIASKEKLDSGQPIAGILGREFYDSEKPRSAFNATMQGSIAQAMQITIRKIWEMDFRLLVETHDSITVACNKDTLRYTIRTIANLMCRPFDGILASNPIFPVRVNVGDKWCQWKPCMLCLDVDNFQKC
jgi:hypothetical protein